jgi:hypothetical protein
VVTTDSYTMGAGVLPPRVKLPGRKAGHSPPSSSKVNVWSYTSTPPYVFTASSLIKYKDKFTAIKFITRIYSTRKILPIINLREKEN